MRPRLLIIGASGFVGSRWAQVAQSAFQVIRGSRQFFDKGQDDSVSIDITDADSVRSAFDRVRPEFVTQLATLSDIDRCERERDLAELVNHQGTANVARQCARVGARLLFTSTDAVFDGTKGAYYEDDPPTPPNWYGQTKARAEAAVRELAPRSVVARLSLVLGRSLAPDGNSYLDKVVGNLKAGIPIAVPSIEFRNPIDVATLCDFLLELSPREDASGIFHIGASDKMSRYELTRAIANHLGYDPSLVVAQDAPVPGRAPRGRDDFLVTDRLRQFCRTGVPTCREVIERAVNATA